MCGETRGGVLGFFESRSSIFGEWTPGPLPPCGVPDPPPPPWQTAQPSLSPKVSMLNVCTDPKASCQDMWIYPELPSMLCFKLSDIIDSFSMSRCLPAKNQMSCCPTIMDKSLTRMRLIHSQISQALPYSQILVKLCPVLVLPNKLNFNR